MLAWALRVVILWGAMCGAGLYAWDNRTTLLGLDGQAEIRTHAAAQTTVANTVSFKPDRTGHVYLGASVNGAPVRFIVDTGASFVTLRLEDARAAGLGGELHYTVRSSTANGQIRMAPVRLRELRIGQLVMEDVEAAVVDSPLAISLLGMSFLKRLDGYEMRDGALVMSW